MQSSNIPARIPLPFATSGTKNTIPELASGIVNPNNASFEAGFPPLTMQPIASGGLPPYGQDMNGVLYAITQGLRWANAGGSYVYDNAFCNDSHVGGYPKGAVLQKANLGGFWLNTAENNVTNPDTGGAGWVDLASILTNIPVRTSITGLRAQLKTGPGYCFVSGYYASGDGGGGMYYYNASDVTSADNGGTIIVASDGGRWYLVVQTSLSVLQFGAIGNNTADDTASIQSANTVAKSFGRKLYFPAPLVAYKYSPASLITIQNWEGEDQYSTVINVANSYAGEAFRVLNQGSLQNFTIQTPGLTHTAGSLGVRVSAASTANICVNAELRRVYIRGFDKNLDLQNVYLLHADHVQCESGNYGVYCVPDATTLGYITTHTWINCDLGLNGVNAYYNPANYSNTVTFVGGNISGATGAYQSYFNKTRVVKFLQTYFEASPSIKAIALVDADYISIDGGFLNGTGGILVGSGVSTRLEIRNTWGTSTTDNITGADGNQMLSLYNSNLGTGSSALNLWKTLTVENSNYNGALIPQMIRGLSFGFKDTQQSGGGTNTIDMNNGNEQRLTVIDTAAFTVGAPANALAGQTLDLTIQNSIGGAMGVITWNAIFKLAGWVNPASGSNRTARYRYDGSAWHLTALTAADIPN